VDLVVPQAVKAGPRPDPDQRAFRPRAGRRSLPSAAAPTVAATAGPVVYRPLQRDPPPERTVSHPAAWQPDPTGKHDHRWWDGERWTEHVADAGQASVDPIEGAAPPPPGDVGGAGGAAGTAGDAGAGWVGTTDQGDTGAGAAAGTGGGAPDTGGEGTTELPAWSRPGEQDPQPGWQGGGEQQGWQGGQQPGAQGWQGDAGQGWQGGQQPGWQGGQQPGAQGWQGGPASGPGGQGWQGGSGGAVWQQGGGGRPGGGTPGTDGVAVAALIVGILAILVSWIPVVGALAGIIALVLGLVGRSRIKKSGANGNGMAVTGIATGAVAIAINVAIIAFFVIAGGDIFGEFSTYVECVEETGDEELCQRQMEEGLFERFGQ
jgi:hypothetical protein